MKGSKDILALYDSYSGYLSKSSTEVTLPDFGNILASMFTPGPFYYYIMDSGSLTFDYCSPSVTDILGKDLTGLHLSDLIAVFHPDDMPFVYSCEDHVAKFIQSELTIPEITNYKFSYALREKTKDGSFQLFLMQTITLSVNVNGALEKVMGIHANISAITTENSRKLSIMDITGKKTIQAVEVFRNELGADSPPLKLPKFTKREREVILLIGEGLTTKEISGNLIVSEETIISHRKNILYKSGCRNTAQLIAFCVRNGLI